MPVTPEEFLAHYGVPGMKWGKRKSRGSGDSGSSLRKRPASSTAHLSDAELKAIIGRKLLEKQYAELTKPKPTAGQKFIQGVLTDSGKKIATQYASEYGAKAVAKGIALASAKVAAKAAVAAVK